MEKASKETTGTVFNIKRFSVHDGPGIRTSIFLKGCPLNCIWCHNPEGIDSAVTIWYNRNICISCGECITACRQNALGFNSAENRFISIDRSLCTLNGDCVRACPSGAIEFTGRIYSVSAIMEEVRRDITFYIRSGGGVTITGGEPLFQPQFCLEILKACKAEKIDTAIETSLFCEREVLVNLLDRTDLFIVDMKIFDPGKHEQYTGKSNIAIKENLKYLADTGKEIIVRVPLIRGITDSAENLESIRDFVVGLNGAIPVEYLNYNPLAKNKYQKLGLPSFTLPC